MDKVRLALVLLTVAITVGPILGIVLAYRDNLIGLIVPSEMNQMMNGLENINPQNIMQPQQAGPPDVQYDASSRTFTAAFPMKNPFPFDTTIDSMSGPIECDEHSFSLGTMSLKSPVNMKAGETATVTVRGTWTDAAVNHFETAHQGERTVKVSLAGVTIKAGSLTVKYSEPISIGEIPLT